MAFSSNNKKKKMFNEINITPLTDIFLVLLIIMMVVAPSFQSMQQVSVPEVNNGSSIEESKVTVSIDKSGAMYLNGDPVEQSSLTDKLIALKGQTEKAKLIVKADKDVKSSTIMDVMDAAQNAEYQKLIVAGEPLNRQEQSNLADKAKHNKDKK